MEKSLQLDDLGQFTGTEHWYRHCLVREILYTDGVQHVAEEGGANWLLDEIAFPQKLVKKLKGEEFQVWTLTVTKEQAATLTCGDGNDNQLYQKKIEYTDFPLPEIKFYLCNNVIMLPSEY